MKITGELLKSERIKKNISQQDVAHVLKLSVRIINAIEEGNLSQLPAKVFVRGFVKSYSDFLKLDTEMILNQFQEEMGVPRPKPNPVTLNTQEDKKTDATENQKPSSASAISNDEIETINPNLKVSFNKSTALVVIIIIVGLVLASVINEVINKYKNEGLHSETEISDVLTNSDMAQISTDPNNATAESKGTSTNPSSDNTTAATPEDVKKEEAAKSEAQTDTTKAPPKYIEIVLEALADTTISYAKSPSKEYKNFTLKQNTLQIIKSNSSLHLKIQNGNAVQITVNGVNKGPASKNDEPVEFNF